ncbi:hypothetical protein DERF_000806 [Dermatophagoides farinae]|uniref:Serine/threonine-protein kinase ATR n=1 Tax=Dermatophagoides farinae TaxID=6954 RepID=A0A922I854_DERFA|nr:uncharacterized protein LOC124495824 [Dermatophagoides farinae]KAH7641071.1 serine/threonine-protein kinase atr-like protein [Dermatophagoides farinae]KAH9526744.1 hypothetical protein DERF_000806 [Dermatophagoides farinae]
METDQFDNCDDNVVTEITENDNESNCENHVSYADCMEIIESNFAKLTDKAHLITWTEYTINFLRKLSCFSNRYNRAVRIYYRIVNHAISDPYLRDLSSKFDEFFIEFEKKISSLKSSDDECSTDWNRSIIVVDQIFDSLAKIPSQDQLLMEHPFFLSTIPIALKTLAMISMKFHCIAKIVAIFEKIQDIVCKQMENVPKPQWLSLSNNLLLAIRIFTMISVAKELSFDKLKRLVLLLLNNGIGGDDCSRQFRKILITRAFIDLPSKTNVLLVKLFLDYQKDIGQLMVRKLRQNFDLNFLLECSNYFGIDLFTNELLFWIIPDFILECDQRICTLLDQVIIKKKLISQNKRISLINQYFNDIVAHLFFTSPDDTDFLTKIYEMVRFLSNYCECEVLEFLHKFDINLADTILRRFAECRNRSLKALSFIHQVSKLESVDKMQCFQQIDLNHFEMNKEEFQRILQEEFFTYHVHRIDRLLIRKDYCHCQIEEKIVLCQSFLQTLQELDDSFLNLYRVRIYFIIRLIVNENSDIRIIEIGLEILEHFVIRVGRNYLQMELLSICLLIVRFAQHLPRQTGQLLMKLLCRSEFPVSILYQLSFLPDQTNNPLKPAVDILRKRFSAFTAIISPQSSLMATIASSSASIMDAHSSSLLDTNNNRTTTKNYFETLKTETIDEQCQLINHIKSVEFGLICREIYFLLQNLDECTEIQLQEILLHQIYQRLDTNRKIFYRICQHRSLDASDFGHFLAGICIDLKIEETSSPVTAINVTSSANDSIQILETSSNNKTVDISLMNFFRQIIFVMLKCLKFSTRSEIQKLATSCLGVVGAISPNFLQLDLPFTCDDYCFDVKQPISKQSHRTMIDYADRKLFVYKKRPFKVLVLDILMEQIRTASCISEYNSASYALQKLLPLFTDRSIGHSGAAVLGCSNLEFDTQTAISTQKIERFVQNDGHFKGSKADFKKIKLASSQELKFLDRCDQIKQFLLDERNEYLNLDRDFDGELQSYRCIFGCSTLTAKDLRKSSPMEMEKFFDHSIKATMSFLEFVQSLIHMLYHSFLIPKLKNSQLESYETFTPLNNEEIFSQIYATSQSVSGNFHDLRQEFADIKQRIGQIRTPESFFLVCYHSIKVNVRLSYLLLPGLLIVALANGSNDDRQKFAQYFRCMIEEKFLACHSMFSNELGAMAADLICCLHDFLADWIRRRRLAHGVVIGSKFLRDRTIDILDPEYYGVKLWMDQMEPILLARLCCRARNYSRALQYLENVCQNQSINEDSVTSGSRQHSLATANDEFVREHFQMYVDIYHGLDDLEALQGLTIRFADSWLKSYHSFLYQEFHHSLLNNNSLEQLIYGNRLLRSIQMAPATNESEKLLDILTLQDKFFGSMLNVELPWISLDKSSIFTSDGYDQYRLLEAKWKLNEWDMLSTATYQSQLNIDHSPSRNQWQQTGIGEIFSAMHQKKSPFLIDSKLSDVRQSFQNHLDAALITNAWTAYNRTYNQSILPLHMMHDIQQFVTVIYNRLLMLDDSDEPQSNSSSDNDNHYVEQLRNSFHEIITEWRLRNLLLPESQQRQQIMDVQRALIELLLRHENKIGHQMSCDLREELFRFEHDSIRYALQFGRLDRATISLAKASQIREQSSQRSSWKINDDKMVDFLLDHAQVLWNKNQRTESIQLLNTELEKRYHPIQRQCYIESLKNCTPLSEQDLYNLSNTFALNLSHAQIIQMSGGSNQSLSTLVNCNNSMRASARSRIHEETVQISDTEENLFNFGKIQLRLAKYSEYGGSLNIHALTILYKSVTISCPQWEEAHFQLAMFYRRLYRQYQNASPLLDSKTGFLFGKPNEILDLKARTMKSICESLRFGSYKFVRFSLPTLLDIWFNMGYEFWSLQNRLRATKDQRTKTLHDLCKILIERSTSWIREMFTSSTNDAIFLIELDTLIGHLLHPIETIAKLVEEILTRLIADFPHHMAWLISRSLSTRIGRRGVKTKELIQAAQKICTGQQGSNNILSYFGAFNQFSDCLQSLAIYKESNRSSSNRRSNSGNKGEISLKLVSPNLIQCLQMNHKFALPSNQFFLPNSMNLERLSRTKHDHDDDDDAHYFRTLWIEKFQDKAQVMTSLQQPKRLTLYCHNGVKRQILVKYGDDLRRDRTMLAYCNLFNQCYRDEIVAIEPMSKVDDEYDAQRELKIWARRRQQPLVVRTYFAVALTDTFGVIEWIPGLASLKSLAEKQYSRTKCRAKQFILAKNAFIKSVCAPNLNRDKRVERFRQHFENFCPPVLQNWFQQHYVDAYSWYQARRNFTRTTAVFSMLGYILGLGDRHTDNVLFDPQTGQMVQVDFNCLFNRGEEFIVPELIPFRLTHNMTAAMGTNGYEGLFRSTCENVLIVCRQFREIFSHHVQIFLYDKFLDWNQCSDRNEIAEKCVFNVEARLFGITSRLIGKLSRGNIMSVAGQVDYVIKEATDVNNLGALYYGWAAYI